MQKLKWSSIVLALIYIALGLIFIIRPIAAGNVLCYILAAAVAVIGLLYVLGYFIQLPGESGHREGNGFALGILLIIMAIFVVAKQELVISLVPFLFGVMVLIRGLIGIQNMLFIRRLGGAAKGMFLSGLVTMGLGLFIMLFPFKTAQMLFVLIGIGMLLGGLSGLAEEIVSRMAVKREEHEAERRKDTHDARDVEVVIAEEEEAEKAAEEMTEVSAEATAEAAAEAAEEAPVRAAEAVAEGGGESEAKEE